MTSSFWDDVILTFRDDVILTTNGRKDLLFESG